MPHIIDPLLIFVSFRFLLLFSLKITPLLMSFRCRRLLTRLLPSPCLRRRFFRHYFLLPPRTFSFVAEFASLRLPPRCPAFAVFRHYFIG